MAGRPRRAAPVLLAVLASAIFVEQSSATQIPSKGSAPPPNVTQRPQVVQPTASSAKTAATITPANASTSNKTADLRAVQVEASVRSLQKSAAADYWATQVQPFAVITPIVTSAAAAMGAVIGAILVLIAGIALIPGLIRGVKQGGFTVTLPQIGSITIPAAVNRLQSGSVPPPVSSTLPPANVRQTADPNQNVQKAQVARAGLKTLGGAVAGALPNAPGQKWAADVQAYYSSFFQVLTASQLTLLQKCANSAVTVDEAKQLYQDAAASRGAVSTFEAWIGYPERYGMIETTKGATSAISLTERGHDFLEWGAATGHGLDLLTQQGRYF